MGCKGEGGGERKGWWCQGHFLTSCLIPGTPLQPIIFANRFGECVRIVFFFRTSAARALHVQCRSLVWVLEVRQTANPSWPEGNSSSRS